MPICLQSIIFWTWLEFKVEGLLEDIDFKAKVSREEFEEMNKDLFDRVTKPIEDALHTSQVTLVRNIF